MDNRPQVPTAARGPPASTREYHGTQWPSQTLRPLSDIREITEPSLIDMVSHVKRLSQQAQSHRRNVSNPAGLERGGSTKRKGSLHRSEPKGHVRAPSVEQGSSSYSSTPEGSSGCYAIPQSSVPRRSSSQAAAVRSHSRKPSIRSVRPEDASKQPAPDIASGLFPRPSFTVPNHGASESPVKDVGNRLDPVTSELRRVVPSKTFIRSPPPADMLESPTYRHPRVKLELQASAPLFVGGGSIEGSVKMVVDDNEHVKHRRSLGIAAISVDLLGFEEVGGSRRAVFLALGTDLLDSAHPPPGNMMEPENPLFPGDRFWTLKPSVSALPFMVSLPLDTGPPPFSSKHASIHFLLSVTATIRDAGKHYRVRCSQDVYVLATYDPERALTSLPSPLIASDELSLQRWVGVETMKITAGLHRQVWVSGSSIFVDVHISNKTHKTIKRIDLTLERDILCYRHAAAATLEKSAGQGRIFESNYRLIIAKSSQRQNCEGWKGTEPYSSDTRTCELELPRGHATIKCGKYFEVRYFLNVTASISNSKLVSVQLPIILIHMNSLDVLPNSVAQVAAAIEEKRAAQRDRSKASGGRRAHAKQRSTSSPARTTQINRKPSYSQGRAFAAPRLQSLERQRAVQAQVDDLRDQLDASPRKIIPQASEHATEKHYNLPQKGVYLQKNGSTISFGALSMGDKSSTSGSLFGSIRYHTPPRKREARLANESEAFGLRERLRRMHSFDSLHSKKSIASTRSQHRLKPVRAGGDEDTRPVVVADAAVRRFHIAPHTLGLTSSYEPITNNLASDFPRATSRLSPVEVARPATSISFREKLDRSRFEFKAVRRKASGGLRGRGKLLIERVRLRDGDGGAVGSGSRRGEVVEWI